MSRSSDPAPDTDLAAELEISFPYSPAEHAAAMAYASQQRKQLLFIRGSGILAMAGMAAVSTVGAVVGEPLMPLLSNTLPIVALGGFWTWGAPAILYLIRRRQLSRDGAQEGRQRETLSFGPGGFRPGAQWANPVPWDRVTRVWETDRFILIDASSDGPSYIPKHALSPADRATLVAFLRERFSARQEQLRLR